MAITAFTSTAIIDATTIGTTVLTASSTGIAADAIGLGTTDDVTFNSVDCVDGDFSGTVTANTLTSDGANLSLQKGGSDAIIVGGTFIQCYKEIRPSVTDTYSSGTEALRWTNVHSVDGSFSGDLINEVGGSYKLYNLGTDGDADTEFVSMAWATNDFEITADKTGTGTVQDLDIAGNQVALKHNSGTSISTRLSVDSSSVKVWRNLYAGTDSLYSCGTTTNRWSNVASVNGDFSGSVTVDTDGGIVGSDYLRLKNTTGTVFYVGANARIIHDSTGFYPNPDGFGSIGKSDRRFAGFYGVDGSFSGNLISEVGGSIRQYGLGIEGDADTEFLNIAWDTNTYYIEPKQTGTGANRNLYLRAGNRFAGVNIKTNAAELVASSSVVLLTASSFSTNRSFVPTTNGTLACGLTTNRWSNVASVDGDFSGNMTLSNLPTSDPAVAGQLWNDSGTVKISSG